MQIDLAGRAALVAGATTISVGADGRGRGGRQRRLLPCLRRRILRHGHGRRRRAEPGDSKSTARGDRSPRASQGQARFGLIGVAAVPPGAGTGPERA